MEGPVFRPAFGVRQTAGLQSPAVFLYVVSVLLDSKRDVRISAPSVERGVAGDGGGPHREGEKMKARIALFVVAIAVPITAAADADVTVTGCIVRGDEGGFLVADLGASTSTQSPPATIGTTGKAARVLYLLKNDDNWKEHAGNRVELTGEIEGEVEEGKIEVERKDAGVQVQIEADGKTVKAVLPKWTSAVVSDQPVTDKESETKYLVHKLDVKTVKMIGSCQ
jgi:hypothetical protein